MYQIKQNGSVIGYSDDVIFVRLHENGCYVPCELARRLGTLMLWCSTMAAGMREQA